MFNFIKRILGFGSDVQAFGMPRSGQWPRIRKEHLQEEAVCQVCGGKEDLTVHHVVPFHLAKTMELDRKNLITLCEKNGCHLIFGHLMHFGSYNENVREDTKKWQEKIKNRP